MPKGVGYNSSPNKLKKRDDMKVQLMKAIEEGKFESAKMPKPDPKKIK